MEMVRMLAIIFPPYWQIFCASEVNKVLFFSEVASLGLYHFRTVHFETYVPNYLPAFTIGAYD